MRDAPTLLSYGALAAYAFWLYAFGPALSLLRAERHLSYTLVGAFSAVWSGGAALSGLIFAATTGRLGRRTTLWAAAVVATAGAVLFAAAGSIGPGLLGAGLLGFAGTTVLSVTQSVLADRHGRRRGKALIEANVGAAACAVLGPLVLGGLAFTPAGWRSTLALPALALAALFVTYRRLPLTAAEASPRHPDRRASRRLPPACRLLALLVALGIAVEFCLIYFGAEQLESTSVSAAGAATALSALYVGILGGRIAGAIVTRVPGRDVGLLWGSLALSAAGFLMFWSSGTPAVAVAGLALCGVGIANLYPLSLALALAASGGRTDAANARTQLLGGVAVVLAPQLLGTLADSVGLHPAFAVELVLLAASAVLLGGARTRFSGETQGAPR